MYCTRKKLQKNFSLSYSHTHSHTHTRSRALSHSLLIHHHWPSWSWVRRILVNLIATKIILSDWLIDWLLACLLYLKRRLIFFISSSSPWSSVRRILVILVVAAKIILSDWSIGFLHLHLHHRHPSIGAKNDICH